MPSRSPGAPRPPLPPHEFPPARTVVVPDRGEFFLRDSGGPGPVLLMLHGWVASADLNFGAMYDDLITAGYRVVALDHRGHGRGPRALEPFRLLDCATDAVAVAELLALTPVIIYGYSMGGAIAQLIARERPDIMAGLVLSGTAQHWREHELRRDWRAMPLIGLGLSLAPVAGWRAALKHAGAIPGPHSAWLHAEMTRHSARAIAQAGRELGRFDSRAWLRPPGVPTAVVITTADDAVPSAKQRELASALGANVFEAPVRHLDVAANAAPGPTSVYNRALLTALDWVRPAGPSGRLAGDES